MVINVKLPRRILIKNKNRSLAVARYENDFSVYFQSRIENESPHQLEEFELELDQPRAQETKLDFIYVKYYSRRRLRALRKT